MEITVTEIDAPEDDFNVKISNELFYVSKRELESIVKGLKEGGLNKKYRDGEEVNIEIWTGKDGIMVNIELGYNTKWSGVLDPSEYYTLIEELDKCI